MDGRAIEHFATGQFLPVKDAVIKECFNDRLSHSMMVSIKHTGVLECLVKAGFQYLSSILWGGMIPYLLHLTSHLSVPGKDFPGLWELPGHG